jgi:hypothetical protein
MATKAPKKNGKWMQTLKLKKGALTKQAKREGGLKNGISETWMKKKLSTKKRIRLAIQFKKAKSK